MTAPLKTIHRLLDTDRNVWVPVSVPEWWRSAVPGDIWETHVDMSVRTVEIIPQQFVPPRKLRS